MDGIVLCPRCTQTLPSGAVFCRRCGMALPRAFAAVPPLPHRGRPPVPAKFQSSSRGGLVSLAGILLFGFLVAGFNLMHTSRPMIAPQSPTVVFPNVSNTAAPQANGSWPQISPAIPVTPAYPVTPSTVYRPEPPVIYRTLPEKPYRRFESH